MTTIAYIFKQGQFKIRHKYMYFNKKKYNLFLFIYLFQKCADYDVSDKAEFPTFARTNPPATQVAKPIISLLLNFNWKKFTLIFGSLHKSKVIAEKIRELAAQNNITINDEQTFTEPHIPLTMGNPFPGIVERTFVDTRGRYYLISKLSGFLVV